MASTIVVNVAGKIHELTQWAKKLRRNTSTSKYLHPGYLLVTKGKAVTLQWKKPKDTTLAERLNVNITRKKIYGPTLCVPDNDSARRQHHWDGVLAKNA